VVITLTSNNTNATIDGVATDIATYSGTQFAPGSITPVLFESRMYLPLRFLANAFEGAIEWNPSTSSVTIHR